MKFFSPEWPVAGSVRAIVTTSSAGNLATHVGLPHKALSNRQALIQEAGLPAEPRWLEQIHGDTVLRAGSVAPGGAVPRADAAITEALNVPIVVMVADCLPILLATRHGDAVAVVHAGWRGLANGVIARTVREFGDRSLVAWLGPAIGPCHYEVDEVVRSRFDSETGFRVVRDRHWMMDLYSIATEQLLGAGVTSISGGDFCTRCDTRFFSHRQSVEEHVSEGRIALIAWIADDEERG